MPVTKVQIAIIVVSVIVVVALVLGLGLGLGLKKDDNGPSVPDLSIYTLLPNTNFADINGAYNANTNGTLDDAQAMCNKMGDACLGYNSKGTVQKYSLLAGYSKARKSMTGVTYYVRTKYLDQVQKMPVQPWGQW